MNQNQRRLDDIYLAAAEVAAEQRDAFVVEACAGDQLLLMEVQALLRYQTAAETFLEEAALAQEAKALVEDSGPSLIGREIGGYRILSLLGMGGMGEVYRATDLKLGRDAALKVLGRLITRNRGELKRFEEEARLASGLNHPNIVTIYGVGEDDRVAFLAMEFVDGDTLRDVCTAGCALPVDRALDLAAQLTEALAAAHNIGIVHGDLKPENLMVTREGRLKVLDFGLATRQSAANAAVSIDGMIYGSVGYMSPEQAAGERADASSDQFSFGAILYEMLSGQRAFPTLARNPPLSLRSINPSVDADLEGLVHRCLSAERTARYSSTTELAADIRLIRSKRTAPDIDDSDRSPVLTRRRALWLGGAAAIAAAGVWGWRGWSGSADAHSIAVLPFANAGNDGGEADYICEGITDSLIRRISQLRSVRVMARSSVFNFKGTSIDARTAGQRLSVNTILTGTVAKHADRLRITAELTDVPTGNRLWSNTYERPASDVVAVQDEIAAAIVNEGIRLRLSGDDQRRLARHPTDDPDAYELYLRAMHHISLETEEDYLNARALLRQAIARDSTFALAHVALASTYAVMAIDGFERPTDAWPESNRSTRRALELDADLPDAHGAAAAEAFFFKWDWAAAGREWQMALDSPGGQVQPDLLGGYSLLSWALGRTDEALKFAREARKADPLSVAYKVREADFLLQAGQVDPAVELYNRAIQDAPADPRAYFGLAEARRTQSRFDEAIDVRRRAHQTAGDRSLDAVISTARGADGYRKIEESAARAQLDGLKERAATAYVSPLDVSRLHALLGHRDTAFELLESAFTDRSAGLVFLNVDRSWNPIRGDRRFAGAVRRVGLS